VVALIAVPVIKLGKSAKVNRKNFILPAAVAVLVAFLKVNPIYVILSLILIGVAVVYARRGKHGSTH
jgi:chromate transporter